MRVGLTVSIIGHAAILGFGFLAFPEGKPYTTEAIEALPVDLVQMSDVTDLLQGDKKAEPLPEEKPQPLPEIAAEEPAPKPTEKPAEQPVEAARAPAPQPEPPPEPEPEPEPEEQVAALPPTPEPEPEPPPAPEAEPLPEAAPETSAPAPAEARLPRARPTPPKPVAQPKPPPPKPQQTATRPTQEFNPDDIAALLNKQEPAGGGAPQPSPQPQTLGSSTGRVDAAMTQSWLAALTAKLAGCWRPPVGVREAHTLTVRIIFNLMPDGSLAGPAMVVSAGADPLSQVAAETALRAVAQCAPYSDVFPAEHYDIWRQSITVDFDPREMFGAAG